jgi:hypothetical protein
MYVDTRLHIAVRPALEYRLPAAGAAVRAVLLGDGSAADAREALRACVGDDDAPATAGDACEGALAQLCARVVTHAHEHLHELAADWSAHLHRTHEAVRRTARDLRRRTHEASAVCARYRSRAPAVVDDEHRRELARLSQELEDALDELRAAGGPPARPRPEALCEAASELKEAFARAYGTTPTPLLMRTKVHFETELRRVEQEVGARFVRDVVRLV